MIFHNPHRAETGRPSRKHHILHRYPQAGSALKLIDETANDLPFGSPISDICRNYHFPDTVSVQTFFYAYLSRQLGRAPDPVMLSQYTDDAINRYPEEFFGTTTACVALFENIADEHFEEIDSTKNSLTFCLGPTGSGKTIFSKSLFTVCLKKFWKKKIIPTRVEYSKFSKNNTDPLDLTRTNDFYSYIRYCKLRDLINYVLFSGHFSHQDKYSLVTKLSLRTPGNNALLTLIDAYPDMTFDGHDLNLNESFQSGVMNIWDALDRTDRDSILFRWSQYLEVRYLVSFDGFDIIKSEDFLFNDDQPLVIKLLIQLVKGQPDRSTNEQFGPANSSHYIMYIRDTTFERLRSEIQSGVGGPTTYPIFWIVPPRYDLLIDNAARQLAETRTPESQLSAQFVQDIYYVFDSHIFDRLDGGMKAATHMNFVFGSSARRMKEHIKQTLLSSMFRISQSDSVDFERLSSGIDSKTIWELLVKSSGVRTLPHYVILEDLFLHETRQLFPRLDLSPTEITEHINRNDLSAVRRSIIDRDEATSTFGCLFNYFFDYLIKDDNREQPGLLLLVRILQYFKKHPRRVAAEVSVFLESLGYKDMKPAAVRFCLVVLMRAELLKWDGRTGQLMMEDVPLYVTTRGVIAIDVILYSISYISENILNARHYDRSLSDHLRPRETDNAVWAIDCVHNATIALYLWAEIEKIERENSLRTSEDFSDYALHEKLKKSLQREAFAIVRGRSRRGMRRWEENLSNLRALKKRIPELIILGEEE